MRPPLPFAPVLPVPAPPPIDVLAPLAEDPYEDDNGYFLVREAAGFTE